MLDNPEGGELDPAEGVRRRCKKNYLSVLLCIGKRTREGCDRGSEVGTVHSRRDGEVPVPPRKPKESGRRESCEKDFVSTKSNGCANLCNDRSQGAGNIDKGKCCSSFGERVCQFITGKSSVTGDSLKD